MKKALYPINLEDPRNRDMIIKEFGIHGEKYIKTRYGADRFAVRRWKELQIKTGHLAPQHHLSGKKASLSSREIKKLEAALELDPFLTNAELADKINRKITPRAVGNYINASPLKFIEKSEATDVEASFSPRVIQECKDFQSEIDRTPLHRRIYVDETAYVPGSMRRRGRFPKGTKFWRPRNTKYPRVTVIGAVTINGWLHKGKIYNKGSITTADFNEYVKKTLAPLLKKNQFVFWDRLGRSGRSRNPTALHYSPSARRAVEKTGAKFKMLPPMGKLFNPIEPIWGDTKAAAEKIARPVLAKKVPSKITFSEKRRFWHKAEKKLTADYFKRAFQLRANGEEFNRILKERSKSVNK